MICPTHGKPPRQVLPALDPPIKFKPQDLAVVRRPDDDITSFYKRNSGEALWSSCKGGDPAVGMGLVIPGTLVIVSDICTCYDAAWRVSVRVIAPNGLYGWMDQDGLQPVPMKE